MSSVKSSKGDSRVRNYATLVYPESAPADWLETLSSLHIPCFVSPLHDKDINPNGEPKKPHYHVQFAFENKKSLEQVNNIISQIGGVGCEVLASLRGYARYLCHLDNPEKYQYDPEGVKSLGGLDYFSTIGLPTDKYKSIQEMVDWCRENRCHSFAELFDYARDNRFDWFRVLCDNSTYIMKEYLKSRMWSSNRSINAKIDTVTGEIKDYE